MNKNACTGTICGLDILVIDVVFECHSGVIVFILIKRFLQSHSNIDRPAGKVPEVQLWHLSPRVHLLEDVDNGREVRADVGILGRG